MRRTKAKTKKSPKRTLPLPDLDHAKLSALNSLSSPPQSQRAYRFAIDDFIARYCSEPRIAFNKTVVLRYRIQFEARHFAPATINLRLAAVRRLAYEPAEVGLPRPEMGWLHPSSEGRKAVGNTPWRLAQCGRCQTFAVKARSTNRRWQARPRNSGGSARGWIAARRSCQSHARAFSTAR